MLICRDDVLYHYLLNGEGVLPSILRHGLLPLSARPASNRWRELQEAHPGLFPSLYRQFAEPVIRRPYTNSGIFLTPIDFRRFPGSVLQYTTRIAVPLDAIDPKCAALTYIWEGQRVVVPLTREELRRAGSRWTKPMIRAWFGRDPNRLFFFVPQVAVYPDHGIPVSADWIDPLPPSASAL